MRPISDLASSSSRRGMLLFLAADLVIFASLLAAYIYLRTHSSTWPVPFHFPSALMAAAMTMFAFCTSVTIEIAVAHQHDGPTAARWLIATLGGWLIFLCLELMEWVRLIWMEEIGMRSPFGESFFALSGFHAVQVIGVVIYLIVLAAQFARRDLGVSALYVHFLNVIWLVLFVALYLVSSDLQEL